MDGFSQTPPVGHPCPHKASPDENDQALVSTAVGLDL